MTEEKDRTAPDVKRVIAGLEYCMGGCQVSCFDCPYREIGQPSPDCLDNCGILNDVVELLKEQEPIRPILARIGNYDAINDYTCPVCGTDLYHLQKYCDECGRAVKWQ